jgi:hypothetical protein
LTLQNLWFPLIANWLSQNFSQKQRLYLVIERTQWQRNNLLMISLVYDLIAIPLNWETLEKLGNSDWATQVRGFSQVLPLFKTYKVVVLGDA